MFGYECNIEADQPSVQQLPIRSHGDFFECHSGTCDCEV